MDKEIKKTTITCDVKGCKKEAWEEVECCVGWIVEDKFGKKYRKLEKPIKYEKKDLCEEHYKKWCKLTIKLLGFDKELK